MQDYLFLSAISREAVETGRKIVSANLLPSPSPSLRMTNQQRQRDQLGKQLHYRKYKVMLLPEGMARRNLNHSTFNPKGKRFDLSIEVKANTTSWITHKVDPKSNIEEIVLGELEKRSFSSRKESAKAKESKSGWATKTTLIDELGLSVPSTKGKEKAKQETTVWESWPRKDWAIVVPVYSARLSNESTTRYLEWWNRKRKWEEANPELAKQQQRDSTAAASEPVRPEVEEPSPPPAPPASALGEVEAVGGGIVSNSLLSMLSARLGRTEPVPRSSPSKAGHEEAKETTHPRSSKSILLHLTHPAQTSLDWLLQNIPPGYSVVEFPELRIVPMSELAAIEVVELTPEGIPEVKQEEEIQEKKVTLTSGSLNNLLGGYDSDSSSEHSAQQSASNSSLAHLASEHGFFVQPHSQS